MLPFVSAGRIGIKTLVVRGTLRTAGVKFTAGKINVSAIMDAKAIDSILAQAPKGSYRYGMPNAVGMSNYDLYVIAHYLAAIANELAGINSAITEFTTDQINRN